jgi:tetratricopeptide (TPR) repeat protein
MGARRPIVSRKTLRLVAVLLVTAAAAGSAQSLFDRGEDLFLRNKPQQAVPLLEQALEAEPGNPTIYMYLGVAYEQLGQRDRAVEVLRRGVEVASEDRERMFLTMGNNLRFIERYEAAEQSYGEAISADSLYAPAYLARANLRVEMESYEPAIEDYEIFLNLRPQSEHRPEIERMIALLRDKVEEEQRRAVEETERRKREEELARREAERRQAEEEARQKALLDSVLNSLEGASEETQNMSGGSEDIRELEEDIDIVE